MRYLDPFIRESERGITELSMEERELVGHFLENVLQTMNPPTNAGKEGG